MTGTLRWQFLLTLGGLVLWATLAPLGTTMTAQDVDALAGGAMVVGAIQAPDQDLQAGFSPVASHPERRRLTGKRAWRAKVSDAPLPRWQAALSLSVTPEGVEDDVMARAFSALWIALVLLIGGLTLVPSTTQRPLLVFTLLTLALILTPGVLDALVGAGASSISALAMALFLWSGARFIRRRRGFPLLSLGLALLLACHPAGLVAILTIWIAVAVAWLPMTSSPRAHRQGGVPLPEMPLMVLAFPLVSIALLVLFWPALWDDTGRRLGAWFTDTWWLYAPPELLDGHRFVQPETRAPFAWVGVAQWLSWLSWPLVVLWGLGLAHTVKRGRTGHWLPILTLFGVLLVGGLDGGLFGSRQPLLPWVWVATALTATEGALFLFKVCDDRVSQMRLTRIGVPILALILVLGLVVEHRPRLGAAATMPLPVDVLVDLSEATPQRLYVASGHYGQGYQVPLISRHTAADLVWADAAGADWMLVIHDGSESAGDALKRVEGTSPRWSGLRGGVAMSLWAPRP